MGGKWDYHDCAIKESKNDRLHRGELPNEILDIIINSDLTNSLSIGICGKWGSGKTTVINFVKEGVHEHNKNIDERDNIDKNDKKIKVIDFSPWFYSTQKDLTYEFLSTLSYNLTGKFLNNLKGFFSKTKRIVNTATKYLGPAEPIIKDETLFKLISAYASLLCSDGEGLSLEQLKNSISERLSKSKYDIVVVIDDIDRLDKNEILMITKLVRSIADFSNIVYILGYDEDVVSKALTCDSYNGYDYLQKIVNISIRLPEVDKNIIHKYIHERYDSINLHKTNDTYHEDHIFDSCVEPYIETIRDANIILNRFKIKYSVSKNNTCPVDLLAITVLEVKSPEVYRWVSDNRNILVGKFSSLIKSLNRNSKWKPSDKYNEQNMDPKFFDFVSGLFPGFDDSICDSERCGAEHHIHNPGYADNYFWLTPESLSVTDEDVDKFLSCDSTDSIISMIFDLIYHHKYNISELFDKTRDRFDSKLNNEYYRMLLKVILFDDDTVTDDEYEYISLIKIPGHFVTDVISKIDDNATEVLNAISNKNLVRIIQASWMLHRYGIIIRETSNVFTDDNKKIVETSIIDRMLSLYTDTDWICSSDLGYLLIMVKWVAPSKCKEVFLHYIHDNDELFQNIKGFRAADMPLDTIREIIPQSMLDEKMVKMLFSEEFSSWYNSHSQNEDTFNMILKKAGY